MRTLKGRRFVFAIIAIICVTITTIHLKYDGAMYLKLVSAIVGMFTIAQTVTDLKNGGKPHD